MGQYNAQAPTLFGEETTFASLRQIALDTPGRQAALRFQGSVTTPATLSLYLDQVVGNPGLALEIVNKLDPVVSSTIYVPTSDDVTANWVDQGGGAFTFADINDRYNSAAYARNTNALAATSSLTMTQRGSAAYSALANTRILGIRVGAAVMLGNLAANAAQVTIESSLRLGSATVTYPGPRQSVQKALQSQTVALTASLATPAFFPALGVFPLDPSTGIPWTQTTVNNLIAATANYGWGLTVRGKVAAGGFAVSATWIEVFTCAENRFGFYYSATAPGAGWNRYTLSGAVALLANTWYWVTVSCPYATQAAYARLPVLQAQKVQEPTVASATGEHRQLAEVAIGAPAQTPYTLTTTPTNSLGDTAAVVRRSGQMFPVLYETAGPTIEAQSQAYANLDLLTIDSSTFASGNGMEATLTAGTSYGGVMLPILWANPAVPPDRPLVVEVRVGPGAISGGGNLVATATITPATNPQPTARQSLIARPTQAQHGQTIIAPFDNGPFISLSLQYFIIVKSAASPAKGWRMARLDSRSDNTGTGTTGAQVRGATQGGTTDTYFTGGAGDNRRDLSLILVATPTAPVGTASVLQLVPGEKAGEITSEPGVTGKPPDALPPRVLLAWPATALTTNFLGYRVYRRRRSSPVRRWVLIADITVPTGYTAATVEAQHTRYVDYELGWKSPYAPGEAGEQGWDYAFTVRHLNGLESFIGSSVSLDNELDAGDDAWLVCNTAPWLNCPLRVSQSRRLTPDSNQQVYKVAGRDHAVVRTIDRVPNAGLAVNWSQLGYLSDEILRAQRTMSLSGRQVALLETTGAEWFGVWSPPSNMTSSKARLDASSVLTITGVDSIAGDYNLPAEIAFDGVNDFALSSMPGAVQPGTQPFSFFVCARFVDAAGVFYLSDGNGTGANGLYILRNGVNTLQAFVRGATTGGGITYLNPTWFDGQPHVALATYDPAGAGTLKLYLDGTFVAMNTALAAGSITNTLGLCAGANNGGASGFTASATRAWGVHVGKAYTDAEAKAVSRYLLGMFGYQIPGGITALYDVADTRCWDGVGTVLNDLSGSANTATINGAAATRGRPFPLSDATRW